MRTVYGLISENGGIEFSNDPITVEGPDVLGQGQYKITFPPNTFSSTPVVTATVQLNGDEKASAKRGIAVDADSGALEVLIVSSRSGDRRNEAFNFVAMGD